MVSVAILGLGNWGKNHARVAIAFLREGRLDRVVLCDTDATRLKLYPPDAQTTTDPNSLLRGDIDAVHIVTPASTHFERALRFLKAGKHVLVEKPMTLRARDARTLVDVADKNRLSLGCGHIFRYHAGVQAVRSLIAEGALGEIRYFATTRTAFAPPRRDVGVMFSLGIHEVDMYPYLLGGEEPLEARANVVSFLFPGIDEIASLFLRFRRGAVGFAFESWITPGGGKERRLTAVGTRAVAEVDYLKPAEVVVRDTEMIAPDGTPLFREGGSRTLTLDAREPLREEIEDFIRAVDRGGGAPPLADGMAGLRAVSIVEALLEKGAFQGAAH